MRHREIAHPHVTTLRIEPAMLGELNRLTRDSETVVLLECEDGDPDGLVTLRIACASEEVARRMEEGWD